MRLTLRSLLAYLDGVLPAGDQQDLAGRVAANAVAQSLVARMRRVIGLPRIGAPRPLGRGLADDANSVAEYLDNSLPSERLETFERICIESDMHLAEVASCHAILAEVVRSPTVLHDLDDVERQRLLRAVRQRLAGVAADAEREESRANAAVVRAAVQAAEPIGDTIFMPRTAGDVAALPTGGSSVRRSPLLAWASVALAVLLLVTLSGVLAWSTMRGGPRGVAKQPAAVVPSAEEVAVREPPAIAEPRVADAPAPVGDLADAPPQTGKGAEVETLSEPLPEETVALEPPVESPRASDAPAPQTADEGRPAQPPASPAAPDAQRVPQVVPQGNALAIAAVDRPAPLDGAAAAQAPAADLIDRPAAAGFVGASSLVLHRLEDGEWAALPPGAALAPRETLVAVPGLSPDIAIGGVTIRLLPGAEVMTASDDDGTPRIVVGRGCVVARASRADARLGITAAELVGTVTAGLTTQVAMSVEVIRPEGGDPASASRVRAEVATTTGAIGWRQQASADGVMLEGIAEEGMLESRSALVWESTKPTLVTIQKRSGDPEWAVAIPAGDAVEKRAAEAVAAKLLATPSVGRGLRELAVDRRAENRCIAAATLALLGDYTAAAELLSADEPGRRLEAKQWTMLEGQTVSLALSRGADHAAALEQAFVTHGPHGKGEQIMSLARGFSDDELAAGAADRVVEALDDPDLVVRRYAIKNLLAIVQPSAADRLRYRADGLPDLRREGANWWRGQLEKGLVRRSSAR